MAPPDPPPYTADDIKNMTNPQEQMRARAELTSYIVRMKKEQQQRLSRGSDISHGYSGYNTSGPSLPFRKTTGNGYATAYNSYQKPISGPLRGAYSRGGGGSAGYHPYQPPASHVTPRFKNKSVVFNKADNSDGILEPKKAMALPTDTSHSEEGHQHKTEPKTLCPAFTSTGVCSRHFCRRLHDPDKQAICKSWLFKGDCPKADACALSHKPTAHNTPTCQHFQEGRCTNEKCRFSHVGINPAAPNCIAFGILGYCEKGADCPELHLHECPHFSNTGNCHYGDMCRLGHVRRASRMRKATRHPSEGPSFPPDSHKEDVDDNAPAEICTRSYAADDSQSPHQFTQQADFVSLGSND